MKLTNIYLVLFLFVSLSAQEYQSLGYEFFFDRQASAKTAAMGRILVLNYDQNFVAFSNPANLTSNKNLSVFYSHSSPYNFLDDAKFHFMGASYHCGNIGAFAFNLSIMEYGEFHNTTPDSPYEPPAGEPYTYTPRIYLYTLTYANTIKDWFNLGININYFRDCFVWDNPFSGGFVELGISKTLHVKRTNSFKYDLEVAGQIKNIFNQSVKYYEDKTYFPSTLRLGLSNNMNFYNPKVDYAPYLFGFTLGFEYQNVLNSNILTAYKVSSEFSILDVLFLRIGYFSEKRNRTSYNTVAIDDVTYGAGLKLDFPKYVAKNIPLILTIDYVNLEQLSVIEYWHFDNFSTFTISLDYQI